MDLTELLNAVDAAVWGPPMIILLLGCHIYTTIRTKVIQRKLPLALKLSVTKDDGAEGDVSNFGAMATSLASTLGTGSIVGVATAVLSGGPGAVLWMWLTGILGMATKYTEVFAAMKYRVKDWRGEMMGGAMHVWEQRYKRPDGTVPWWAKLAAIWFALLACITIFGIGSAVQTSAITSVVRANFGWDPAIVSAFVCGTALLVILGGLQKVSGICEKLVPIMGGAYILGCIYILFCNSSFLVESFWRCGRFGHYVCPSIWLCARLVLERGRPWHRAAHLIGCCFQKPCSSGACRNDWSFLVHSSYLLGQRLGNR